MKQVKSSATTDPFGDVAIFATSVPKKTFWANIRQRVSFFAIAKYLFFGALFYLLFLSVVAGHSINFVLAFLWALVWCNQNVFILSVLIIPAGFLAGMAIVPIGFFLIACAILCFCFLMHKIFKKPLNLLTTSIYLFICQLPFLVLSVEPDLVASLFINAALTVIFFVAVVNFLQPMLLRKHKIKLNTDEVLCGIVLLIAIASGLSQAAIAGINFGSLFVFFAIALVCFCFKNFFCIVLACVIGLGYVAAGAGASMLALFVLFALTLFAFCKAGKYYAIFAALLVACAFVFFLDVIVVNQIATAVIMAVACLLFLLVPNKLMQAIQEVFDKEQRTAATAIAFYHKKAMQKKLQKTSQCFLAIENVFKKNAHHTVDTKNAKRIVTDEIIDRVCKNCKNYARCFANSDDLSIDKIVQNTFERGKSTLLDISPAMMGRCQNVAQIITMAHDLSIKCRTFNSEQENKSVGTTVVASQMREVAKTIDALAASIVSQKIFDETIAYKIESALIYANLPITQVLCEEADNGRLVVSLAFKKGYINHKLVESVVSKTLKRQYQVISGIKTNSVLEDALILQASPPLDVIFGVASEAKAGSKSSGDCHSFKKSEDYKVNMLLCDGMGSGEKARKISEQATELLEVFCSAGMDSGVSLESVNKLLSLEGEENFVAIDMCQVDLFLGIAQFFKLASPESVVLSRGLYSVVKGNSLPIGASLQTTASMEVKSISSGDIIVFMTDGIKDAIGNINEVVNLIMQLNSTNPQEIADWLLKEAKRRGGGIMADDGAVLAARIFEKL